MKKNTLLLLVIGLLFGACASMTKHFTKTGKMFFDGGVYKNKTWDEDLIFKRVTWYREVTAVYDIAYWKIDATSKYFSWFSGIEKARIRNHQHCYVLMTYHEDPKKISNAMMIDQLKSSGFEKINIQTFASYMRMHPQAGEHSIHRYKIYGFCGNENEKSPVEINFPGFTTTKLTY